MSFIKEISISGYRGFGNEQTLNLSTPIEGQKGSGLSILVGPNNGGKSAVLECIELGNRRKPVKLHRRYRNKETDYYCQIKILHDDNSKTLLTSDKQDAEQLKPSTINVKDNTLAYLINSRRILPPNVGATPQDRSTFIQKKELAYTRSKGNDDLSNRVRGWSHGDSRFAEMLNSVFPSTFRERPEGNLWTVSIGGMEHDVDGLGNGVISLLTLLDGLYDAPDGSIILIDEPELSLHPSLQRGLFDMLCNESMKHQIIYTTHSPYFVGWEAVNSGATISRVFRHENAYSQIRTLKKETVDNVISLTMDINNPHILGLTANETLFVDDAVILVEGQEDVVIYKKIADQIGLKLEGSFFGWGVGGASKIITIAQILKDLGYLHVVGIFDGNEKSNIKEARTLFPEYKFVSIPYDDVRDKPKRTTRDSIEGLCASDGTLAEERVPVICTMFEEINNFLKEGAHASTI